MKIKYFLFTILILSLASTALLLQRGAAQTTNHHAGLTWKGAATCLECHEDKAREVQASGHYRWLGEVTEGVNGPLQQGKLFIAVNSYCGNITGNWAGCSSCHVGLGAQPSAAVTTSQLQNIDCLLCHQRDYKRVKQNGVFVPDPAIDINQIVQNVHLPERVNCLQCHAKGGGGDNFKRGDIALAHATTTDRNFDVHMASTQTGNLKCQSCHTTSQHRIAGRGSDLRQTDLNVPMSCSTGTCHPGKTGPNGHLPSAQFTAEQAQAVNRHVAKVACQTCHIPTYARNAADTAATEMTEVDRDWWLPEWSATLNRYEPLITTAGDLKPEYRFWNRLSYNYYLGEAAWVDPATNNYPTSRPIGGINDPASKLYPFKYKTAYYPLATNLNRLIALNTSIFFATGDWDAAIKSGLKNMNYSEAEPYVKVLTDTYQLLNHEIPPKAQALTCNQCHGTTTQMNLPAMGYTSSVSCSQCHDPETSPGFTQLHNKHVVSESLDCLNCHSFSRAGTFIKAKTKLADQVSRTSARINGLVNPGGNSTTVYFQWGTGTGYGNTTQALPIGSGSAEVPVSAVIGGLTPGTTYHFRVVTQDGSTGYDYSFTTYRFGVSLPLIFKAAWQQLKTLVNWV
ncbi:MAG: hypothetical protein MUF69_10655 [Desulfobacterota bacterium]|jgi:hypothetical protein|nr:hypothetical protein [Thermodesulfobacteriota bacterium]